MWRGGKNTVVRTEAEDDYMKAVLSRHSTIVAHVNSWRWLKHAQDSGRLSQDKMPAKEGMIGKKFQL